MLRWRETGNLRVDGYSTRPCRPRTRRQPAPLPEPEDSKPAEVFERLAATAANVPAVLMGQQQKLWDAVPKVVARVSEYVLNEIAWGDFRPEDSSGLDAADVVAELCRRAGRPQAS